MTSHYFWIQCGLIIKTSGGEKVDPIGIIQSRKKLKLKKKQKSIRQALLSVRRFSSNKFACRRVRLLQTELAQSTHSGSCFSSWWSAHTRSPCVCVGRERQRLKKKNKFGDRSLAYNQWDRSWSVITSTYIHTHTHTMSAYNAGRPERERAIRRS